MMPLNLRGQRFGRLVAVAPAPESRTASGGYRWLCRCDCGNTCHVTTGHLRAGNVTSCGCGERGRNARRNRELAFLDAVVRAFDGREQGAP